MEDVAIRAAHFYLTIMKTNIRNEIFKMVSAYYNETSAIKKDFVPGKSKIQYAGRVYNEKELLNLIDSSLEFWLTHGRYSERFERKLASFAGVKKCYLVNSGSSANLLAFMALTSDTLGKRKVERGDEIITVAAGFPTTVSPIIQYGAVPVFVDIKLGTYNIDVAQLKKAYSKKTKAVVLAHTLGNPFDIDAVKDFCKKHNLWLIEDNSDSLGSKYRGKYTGMFGDVATSSFFPAHHITTGEGGAVYTDNESLARIILSMRDWGRDCICKTGTDNTCGKRFGLQFGELPFGYDHKYTYSHFGYNLKATDMQAAIGCAQLNKLQGFVKKRKDNFNELYDGLKELQHLLWLPEATTNSEPSWFGFIMTVKDRAGFTRDSLVQELERYNIQTRLLFAGNIVRQPCFDAMRREKKGYRIVGRLDNTDYVMRNSFWVGLYPNLDREMLRFTVKTIKEFVYKKCKSR